MINEGNALLWLGVVAVGAYHGLNPAMGWPLAVANGLTSRSGAAVVGTFVPLGVGHLLAMAMVLVPFALAAWLLTWGRELRAGAGALVVMFGLWALIARRHPRWTMRVRPTQLLLWSLLMATAHGAALMLLPFLMGLCVAPPATAADSTGLFDHENVMTLMRLNIGTAVAVSLLHSGAMMLSGLAAAWVVYRHFGLRVLRAAWLNLDMVWALCLITSGGVAIAMALWPAPVGGE